MARKTLSKEEIFEDFRNTYRMDAVLEVFKGTTIEQVIGKIVGRVFERLFGKEQADYPTIY